MGRILRILRLFRIRSREQPLLRRASSCFHRFPAHAAKTLKQRERLVYPVAADVALEQVDEVRARQAIRLYPEAAAILSATRWPVAFPKM